MTDSKGRAFEVLPDGLRLHTRLTPKSARDAVEGVEARGEDRQVLKVRVRAVPENGKANEAMLRVIANALGVGVAQVKLEAGATARIKTLRITGDAQALEQRLLLLL